MGCRPSKVDSEEKVARCKARKRFMKHAVASRHQFAASHAAYMQALKNVGAAFRQFGETELRDEPAAAVSSGGSSPSTPDAKPPPRPLFLPPPSPGMAAIATIDEEENATIADAAASIESPKKKKSASIAAGAGVALPLPLEAAPPPPPPQRTSVWNFLDPFRSNEAAQQAPPPPPAAKSVWFPASTKNDQSKLVAISGEDMNSSLAIITSKSDGKELVDVLRELDELFLKAYESGKNAGTLLEARKIHYHSNFVDGKGFDSHSSKVLSALSWSNWPSIKSPLKRKTDETSSLSIVPSQDDSGCHSGTLDRLFVWEKKLYDEMRAYAGARLEYEKKSDLLRHQDAKGDYNESIDKTRAAIKMLQTRIAVANEGVDTACAAIIKIRDEDLYPQLLRLQEGLARMWIDLHDVHEKQYEAVSKMKPLDGLLGSVEATSNIHRLATTQLEAALDNWYSCLNKIVTSQRDYMRNLSGWIRLCVMPFEDNSGRSSNFSSNNGSYSPPRMLPPVHDVCLEWHQTLDRIPDKVALEAIKSFVAVTREIVELQNQELKHRKKVETLSKDLEKKLTFIQNYEKKHPEAIEQQQQQHYQHEVFDEPEELRDVLPPKSPLADRKTAVEMLKRRLDEEKAAVNKAVYDTRAMTLNSLQTGLPSVFQSIAGFSGVCSREFQVLYYKAQNASEHRQSP